MYIRDKCWHKFVYVIYAEQSTATVLEFYWQYVYLQSHFFCIIAAVNCFRWNVSE